MDRNFKTSGLKLAGGLSRIVRSRDGNFGILTAIILPVLIGSAGVAVDFSQMLTAKSNAQAAADSASLGAAAALADQTTNLAGAKEVAEIFVATAMQGSGDYEKSVDITETSVANGGKSWVVKVNVSQTLKLSPLMNVLGRKTADISTAAVSKSATQAGNSMSMYLVLDKSGSMQTSTSSIKSITSGCYHYIMPNSSTLKADYYGVPCMYNRLESIKNAVSGLFAQFEKADPDHKYIRTGAVSYNSDDDNNPSAMAWGSSAAGSYVKALNYGGGTSSTEAFKRAVTAITDPLEDTYHKNKNGLTPKKFILFMTDGENSDTSDDSKTLTACKAAKDKGVTVYTVGFALGTNSPRAKVLLLSCASSPATFFDATDAVLLNAAFATIASSTTGTLPLLTQ
jgi:Flp pilus assembly protein TadG/uncharacterized protein YegL